jgi:hypothetical protein
VFEGMNFADGIQSPILWTKIEIELTSSVRSCKLDLDLCPKDRAQQGELITVTSSPSKAQEQELNTP